MSAADVASFMRRFLLNSERLQNAAHREPFPSVTNEEKSLRDKRLAIGRQGEQGIDITGMEAQAPVTESGKTPACFA